MASFFNHLHQPADLKMACSVNQTDADDQCNQSLAFLYPWLSLASDIWTLLARSGTSHVIILAVIAAQLLMMTSHKRKKILSQTRMKVYSAIFLAAISILQIIFSSSQLTTSAASEGNPIMQAMTSQSEYDNSSATMSNKITDAGTFIMVALLHMMENKRGGSSASAGTGKSSVPLLLFWIAMVTSTGYSLLMHLNLASESDDLHIDFSNKTALCFDVIKFLGALVGFTLSSSGYIRSLIGVSPPQTDDQFTEEKAHPEDSASWYGNISMSWTTGLVWAGFQKPLEETDVPPLSDKDRCYNLVPTLESAWEEEENRCRQLKLNQSRKDTDNEINQNGGDYQQKLLPNNSESSTNSNAKTKESDSDTLCESYNASLFKALFKVYGLKYVLLQLGKTVLEMDDFINPLMTAALMNHINNRDTESVWKGVFIVVATFIIKVFFSTAHHRIWLTVCRHTRHMKTAVTFVVFKKTLSLRNECKKDKTNGELVNLISDDCDRVFGMGQHLFMLAIAPFKIVVALCLLYHYLGWSMLVGVIIMPMLIPLNIFIARRIEKINTTKNEHKDKRVSLMNEIISGIKVLKLYAWEKTFMEKIGDIRSKEMDLCKERSFYNAGVDSMFRAIPFLVKIGAFWTFLWFGGQINAIKGFVTISLFHTLNHPLSLFALFLPGLSEARIALKRITKFINGEDISSEVVHKVAKSKANKSAIRIENGTFSWERSSPKPTLKNIDIDVPKGGLVAVVGKVGSGKSSLLSSILGEMEKLEGKVTLEGRIAYVPQEAWILNATLQNNVLFGSPMSKRRYVKVVNRCCLNNDINLMAAGDRTEIGEKGINLSGGQKQRVSLARAVYNDADVFLFDDPLSAVDAHVGKTIFDKVIGHKGMLEGKTRLLVTHGVHWLPFVDSIIVVKDGQVSEIGTYDQLISRNGAFAQFLQDLDSTTSSQDDDPEVMKMKENILKRLNSKEAHQKIIGAEKEIGESTVTLSKKSYNDINNNNQVLESDGLLKEEEKVEDDDDYDDDDCSIVENDKTDSDGKLVDDEEAETGSVKKGIYLDYIRAIGYKSIFLFIIIFTITIVADNLNMFYVKQWGDDLLPANATDSQINEYLDRSWYYFYSFAFSGTVEVIGAFVFISVTLRGAFNASKRIHDNLLNTILRCPMSFFDTNPTCRVVNRFSSDMNRVDGLGGILRSCIEKIFHITVALTILVISAPAILFCLIPVSVLYYFLHKIHISTVRQLRRFRSKHRSPIFVHFSETLNGVSSIRAYNKQNDFIRTLETKFEEWAKFDSMELAVALWFGLRMSILYLLIQMVAGFVVAMDTAMTAGMAGLILMYADQFAGHLGGLVHITTHMETEIVALERVIEYSKKPTEAPWDLPESTPSSDWPSNGQVILNDLKTRYRPGLDLVLKGVKCNIKQGEKIGIVGRTGAGKSSLTTALFRLVEADSGRIEIDDKQISTLGLHDLRSKLTILPQEPVIFAGSLRMNLDPFGKFSSEELWEALQHSHLKSFIESLPNQLEFECGEGGKNFSVGQRQLLCLARTLLRQTKILVLDEATAAVDMETDKLIQQTIRTEFKECTVLTIAHRLNTIMDYDRILVLDQGLVKEFDSPNNLLADAQSTFYSMAKDANLV